MNYLFHLLVLILIYSMLTLSLDLLAGRTGFLSLAHAGFFAIGAYSSAKFVTALGIPHLLALLLGMIISALISLVISYLAFRLSDDHFVVASYGLQLIIFGLLVNWTKVTGGPDGVHAIPDINLLGLRFETPLSYVILCAVFATFVFYTTRRLTHSPFGRVLMGLREDEIFIQSLGKNPIYFKICVFAISSALAAAAGSLYAHYYTYIDPYSFTLTESILIVSMVIIGGAGSSAGPILGAALLILVPELLRAIGLTSSSVASLRQVIYGVILLAFMLWRPKGLMGQYDFRAKRC